MSQDSSWPLAGKPKRIELLDWSTSASLRLCPLDGLGSRRRDSLAGRPRRDDRQEHEILAPTAEVQRDFPTVDLEWAVARIVVQEGPAAGELVLHVGKPPARAARVDVIAPADAQPNAVALRHHDTGRDDLDVELIDRARVERLLFIVRVIGPERQRHFLVELAVRGAEPALPDRRVRIGQGWLRASHRKLDQKKTLPFRPYHTHDEKQPL